jgi:hypothetical protein
MPDGSGGDHGNSDIFVTSGGHLKLLGFGPRRHALHIH